MAVSSRPPCTTRIRSKDLAAHRGDGVLPLAAVRPRDPLRSDLSRGVRQRLQHRFQEDAGLVNIVDGINALAGFETPLVDDASVLTGDNVEALRLLRLRGREHFTSPREVGISPKEAHEALLGNCMSLYSGDTTSVRPFDLQRVSLPEIGATVKPLADFQDGSLRAMLEGHRSGMVRPRTQVTEIRKKEGCPGLHLDPVFGEGP